MCWLLYAEEINFSLLCGHYVNVWSILSCAFDMDMHRWCRWCRWEVDHLFDTFASRDRFCTLLPAPPLLDPALFRPFNVAVLCTDDTPSVFWVVNTTLALSNMPSFSDTTTNWDCEKCVLSSRPMFCVCDKSRAASTSSRMYIGAGLNRSMANTNDSASKERWPPESSMSDSFHLPEKATFGWRPAWIVSPSNGACKTTTTTPTTQPSARQRHAHGICQCVCVRFDR